MTIIKENVGKYSVAEDECLDWIVRRGNGTLTSHSQIMSLTRISRSKNETAILFVTCGRDERKEVEGRDWETGLGFLFLAPFP